MKKYFFLLLTIIFLFILQCSDDNTVRPIMIQKYPDSVGTEWEYNSIMIYQLYDSTVITNLPDTLFLGNTVVKIISNDDTLSSYNNLTLFESYNLNTPWNKSSHWYLNSDDGLIAIAYLNAGASQPIIPKIKEQRYLTVDEIKTNINFSGLNFCTAFSNSISDSILYYEVPRKVLAYPLEINKRWTELTQPWYRERYVNKMVNINFNGTVIKCYEIKAVWSDFNIEFNDYVSLTNGLIKREVIADSVLFTDPANPDSGVLGKIYQNSDLVRFSH